MMSTEQTVNLLVKSAVAILVASSLALRLVMGEIPPSAINKSFGWPLEYASCYNAENPLLQSMVMRNLRRQYITPHLFRGVDQLLKQLENCGETVEPVNPPRIAATPPRIPPRVLRELPSKTSRCVFANVTWRRVRWLALVLDLAVGVALVVMTTVVVGAAQRRWPIRYQFSIRALLLVTAAFAILCSLNSQELLSWDRIAYTPIYFALACTMICAGRALVYGCTVLIHRP